MHRPRITLSLVIPGIVLLALSCPVESRGEEFAFITTTDYSTGSAAVITLDETYSTQINVAGINSDAVARYYGGLIYVVNRLGGDNIQVLDPQDNFATLRQFSVGNGSNPQDIAFFHDTKAYVSRYESNHLLIVDPSTGAHRGTVDLSSLADGDGLCEMNRLCLRGEKLFVSIQRLDRSNWWLPVGDSYLAVIDCATDTLLDTDQSTPGVQSLRLAGTNPFSEICYHAELGKLYLSTVGTWGIRDAGVEIIDPFSLEVEPAILTEAAAGGDINDVTVLHATRGYAVITNASFHTQLISFDPSTGLKLGTLYSPGAYVLYDIEISPAGELFLCDQTPTDPGVRIYDTGTDLEITTDPIYTGLPPFDICFSLPAPSAS
ncbi:MAG: hypothetical protein JXB45_07975, partial [Candidatus Krumholzibacteriota bacterium]|nr:hypothetical protein [Candidatus Krumholzibacteriota bacterium]